MKVWKKLLSLAVVAAVAALMLYAGITIGRQVNLEEIPENALISKPTVNLWYTDEALGDYLASVALDFSEENDVRVIPKLVSGLEYLESINRESLDTRNCPDLYIIGNDSLEKAYLAGLAGKIQDEEFVSAQNFPETAIHAVTYQGHVVGYPFYYETSALIYNESYLLEMAENILEAEADARAGEEAMQALEEGGEPSDEAVAQSWEAGGAASDGGEAREGQSAGEEAADGGTAGEDAGTGTNVQVLERMNALIPSTVDDILTFADSYDAPEQVEAVFKWDVSDIFYNYFFVGNYIDVGGLCGDDTESIDIYNLDAIRCLAAYQHLNQFFSIEPDEVDYDSVVQEFLDGKLVFTVATTDVISRLEEAKKSGAFPYEYGVTDIPDIDGELFTRSLSVTSAVVVNGYSQKKDVANQFARYLVEEGAAGLLDRTGKIPAIKNAELSVPQAKAFSAEYENSVPIPKMMATSNYWVQMEIAFTRIWSGEEVSGTLKELSERIMTQVKGEAYEEEYIELPVEETEEIIEGEMPD